MSDPLHSDSQPADPKSDPAAAPPDSPQSDSSSTMGETPDRDSPGWEGADPDETIGLVDPRHEIPTPPGL